MKKCYDHEECEYNAQPDCVLPEGAQCPHKVRRTDMERLTYDFPVGDSHCWQVKGADNLECREVCQIQEDKGCKDCPIAAAFDRLAAYEDTGLTPEEIQQMLAKEAARD